MQQSKPFDPASKSKSRFLVRARSSGETLYCDETDSLVDLLESAARNRVSLDGADLPERDLAGANLPGIDLSGAELSHADLSRANLSGADLAAASLVGAYLIDANLEAADLMRTDLSGANLAGARLHRANLGGAELVGAILKNVDMSYCNVDGCNLAGADLEGANLLGTNLLRAIKDKVAEHETERREDIRRLVFNPAYAIIVQVILMGVQVVALLLAGPFQLFWFVGVTVVNVYFMFYRSMWWVLGLIWQTVFLGLLWTLARVSITGH